ncbi:hypothetical protein BDQ17DRAFT_1357039 [Cyathus striatus]|nr:hypothetical protein BDQ17DRAFT_1357039 [Cyathus striatus]
MAKSAKKRKNAPEKAANVAKKLKQEISAVNTTDFLHVTSVNANEENGMIGGLIFADDLLNLKPLKPFKTAVHDYWRAAAEASGVGSSLTSRISSALIDQRHIDALVLLSEMSLREQMPKLGALQRWVRECDAVLSPGMAKEQRDKVWQVLDMILRTTQPELIAEEDGGAAKEEGRLRWFNPFRAISPEEKGKSTAEYNLEQVVSDAVAALKPLDTTPGPQRRPPNKHPCVIYYSVPGAFVITSALDPRECAALVNAAEKVGLLPDEPVAGSAAQKESVLAHNFVWLADEVFERGLFERIKELLPQMVNGGRVKGINRRFRLYRYRKGSVYRPHIDGAWPCSSLSDTTPPAYIYDSDPQLYSRLTLLLYLNSGTSPSSDSPIPDPTSPLDTFTGGHTTFFLPSSTTGVLHARPIQPIAGAAAVFPHGAARGSLLHEGSGVGEGAKYVIRTEVLYEVEEEERVNVGSG